jgi:hypothetical protein
LLRGHALYESDPICGGILHIQIADPAGDFEVLLREREWTGHAEFGEAADCDYLVRLG